MRFGGASVPARVYQDSLANLDFAQTLRAFRPIGAAGDFPIHQRNLWNTSCAGGVPFGLAKTGVLKKRAC